MNQTHIHLLITHLPIFASMLGAFVLAYGLWSRSNRTNMAAYYLFIIGAFGACIAYATGEEAEETMEHVSGILKANIKQHEEIATVALVALLFLGLSGAFGIYVSFKKSRRAHKIGVLILCISIISFLLVARTGYLGGQIRHTEIYAKETANTGIPVVRDED